MKKENKNFLYNMIYQIFIFVIPLITTPYISRILGVNNIGIYSYTYSIVNYFMLCSMLGINNYGAREIAKVAKKKEELSHKFWSIYTLQIILTIIMSIIYFAIILNTKYEYKNIMILQYIFLLSVAIDINWFFFGMEKFKITISRNIIIKIMSLIMIFIFVKNNTDLWKYTLIMSVSTLLSQMYLWTFLKKYINKAKITIEEILSHIKPCLILFIPVIAYSVYRIMDKTMIGMFSNTIELGNYESAEKIINIPISFITALGTVMLPHMSKIDEKDFNKKILDTFELCFCFVIPMALGLFAISENFSDLFFGMEFSKTGKLIKILISTVIFSAIANIIRTSYLIPKAKDKIYVNSTVLGAIVNLILNLVFIKKYGSYGACIGTIAAEFIVMFYQIIKTREFINYKNIIKIFNKYFIKSLFMMSIIVIIGLIIKNKYVKIIIQLLIGSLVYFMMNYKYILYEFLGIRMNREEKEIE